MNKHEPRVRSGTPGAHLLPMGQEFGYQSAYFVVPWNAAHLLARLSFERTVDHQLVRIPFQIEVHRADAKHFAPPKPHHHLEGDNRVGLDSTVLSGDQQATGRLRL